MTTVVVSNIIEALTPVNQAWEVAFALWKQSNTPITQHPLFRKKIRWEGYEGALLFLTPLPPRTAKSLDAPLHGAVVLDVRPHAPDPARCWWGHRFTIPPWAANECKLRGLIASSVANMRRRFVRDLMTHSMPPFGK